MTWTPEKHIPALDGVRAIAIVSVMLLHAASAYFPGGAVGVDVFFVLSAFLITSILMRKYRDGAGTVSLSDFYWRRAFRLAPALGVWLFLVAAPTAALAGDADEIPSSTLVSLTYVGDFAIAYGWFPVASAYLHIWSLAIEEQFYIIWPSVLVFGMLRYPRMRRALITLFVAGAVVVQLLTQLTTDQSYFLPWGHIVAIATGCLAAEWCVNGIPDVAWSLARQPVIAVLVVCAVGLMCLGEDRLSPLGLALARTATSISVGLLVIHASLVQTGLVIWAFTRPVAVWLGRRSYGLYLYHRTLAELIPVLFPGIRLMVAGPFVLAISFIVAELSYQLIERPVMRVGHAWLTTRRSATTADA